eukprot:643155-Prorocentrum_lima.AAC.2
MLLVSWRTSTCASLSIAASSDNPMDAALAIIDVSSGACERGKDFFYPGAPGREQYLEPSGPRLCFNNHTPRARLCRAERGPRIFTICRPKRSVPVQDQRSSILPAKPARREPPRAHHSKELVLHNDRLPHN